MESKLEKRIIRGLQALAFGKNNDAVALAMRGADEEELKKLKLFNVESVKRTKDGMEIKFSDRLKAMELLWEIAKEKRGEGCEDIYSALLMASEGDNEAQ